MKKKSPINIAIKIIAQYIDLLLSVCLNLNTDHNMVFVGLHPSPKNDHAKLKSRMTLIHHNYHQTVTSTTYHIRIERLAFQTVYACLNLPHEHLVSHQPANSSSRY